MTAAAAATTNGKAQALTSSRADVAVGLDWRRCGGELLWVGFGQVGGALGGVIGVRLMTQVLPPRIYGQLALGVSLAMFLQYFLGRPLGFVAARFYSTSVENGRARCYLIALKRLVIVLIALVCGLILVVAGVLLVMGLASQVRFAVAIAGYSLFSSLTWIVDHIQNAARHRAVVALHQALFYWLRFLLAAGLVLALGTSCTVAMSGYLLAAILVLLSQTFFLHRHVIRRLPLEDEARPEHLATLRRQMLTYAWPLGLAGVCLWVQSFSDRWALQIFCSARDVGLYFALFQLGFFPLLLFSRLVVQLVAPILFHRAGDATDPARMHQVHRINVAATAIAAGVGLGAAALCFLLHPTIFRLFVAAEYRGASPLLPWMVLTGGFFGAAQIALLSTVSGVTSTGMLAPKAVSASLGTGFFLFGAYRFGLEGVVWAGLACSTVYLLWSITLQARLARTASRNSAQAGDRAG